MDDFAALVENESRGLIAAVTVIVGDRDRAEEIVQDTFERCYRRWRHVAAMDRPGAWARRVAVNAAISSTRRRAVERRVLQRVDARPEPATPDPLAALDDEGVWAAVRALPRDQAVAIALRYGADLSIEDIAATVDSSPQAIKSLLHRGRVALRASDELRTYVE
jgi:RNA polymerase sigma-70 factor (ECF subfamily)